jgi:hypothetical protein
MNDYQLWASERKGVLNYHEIRNYPSLISKGEKRRDLVGIELEVSGETSAQARGLECLYAEKNLCFASHDSSIYEGFEVVFRPLGKKAYKKRMFKVLNALRDSGLTSWVDLNGGQSCGLHINVPRDNLSNAQLSRLQSFCFLYSEELHKFSGRNANAWVRYCCPHNPGYRPRIGRYCGRLNRHSTYQIPDPITHEKYQYINPKERVLEFRGFRGSLNHKTVTSSVQLVRALIRFSQTDLTSSMLKISNEHSGRRNFAWDIFINQSKKRGFKLMIARLKNRGVQCV